MGFSVLALTFFEAHGVSGSWWIVNKNSKVQVCEVGEAGRFSPVASKTINIYHLCELNVIYDVFTCTLYEPISFLLRYDNCMYTKFIFKSIFLTPSVFFNIFKTWFSILFNGNIIAKYFSFYYFFSLFFFHYTLIWPCHPDRDVLSKIVQTDSQAIWRVLLDSL